MSILTGKCQDLLDQVLGTVAGDDTLLCVSAVPDGAALAGTLSELAGLD